MYHVAYATQLMKPRSGGGLLLLRRKAPLSRRTVAYFCSGAHTMEQIQRAIALGCCRKYVSLLNGTDNNPIFSFVYFRDVIEEVCDPEIPAGYWDYILPELGYLEKKWLVKVNSTADAKCAFASGLKNKETR